ncbi:autotransporter outer membrane beta-barrel domain-containing protein [Achromobacter xylosoxidans]|uniref:autotransporter outer membrane beta-barrel domain-containing protein n=1 Tax=Alcaligenes xylosoxydans xylosoxydans TaxID=85698 RepID=UPI00211B6877|nr:autotransporter outer membrane beta-barrel domain-containing protein [Achromobacter xylosoxidans]
MPPPIAVRRQLLARAFAAHAVFAAGAVHAHAGPAEPARDLLADRPTSPAPARPGWLVAVDNWQTLEGGANTARIKQRTTGVYGGGEFEAGAGWRLGGALGATRSRVRIDAADARLDVYSYTAGAYGKKSFHAGPGKLNLLAAASYTWHDIDTRRHFEMPGIARQTLTADFSAYTAQAFSELSYELALSESATLEPFAGMAVRNVRTRSFSESGGSTALSADAGRIRQTTTTLGLRGQTGFALGPTFGKLHATLGWRRAFGDVQPETTLVLDGGSVLTVAGAPIARSAALAGLGLEVAVSRSAVIGLAYGGQYGGGNREHTGSLSLRWAFGSL